MPPKRPKPKQPEVFGDEPREYYSDGGNLPLSQKLAEIPSLSELHQELERKERLEAYRLGDRNLPIFEYREEIVDAFEQNRVCIVTSETGSGKSTQVPQFLLEAEHRNIWITQPRRIAARNVSDRIGSQLAQSLGAEEATRLAAWQTAEEKTITNETEIHTVTDGLMLACLEEKVIEAAKRNEEFILMIDEIHEWNVNIEILVGYTKHLMTKYNNIKLVCMSATMDAYKIANFFADVNEKPAPVIEVPGREHELEKAEKPNSTVLTETIEQARLGQNCLVFMPGKGEIEDLIDNLKEWLHPLDDYVILPLHSKLTKAEQDAALAHYPDKVKIVVSTNVAQTSLTVPDIDVVVDSGMERAMNVDHEGTRSLELQPVSQADCDQRAGRAGRTKYGTYILTRMDEDTDYVSYINRDKYAMPAILRSDVSREHLRLACEGIDLGEIELLHRLPPGAVDRAIDKLTILGALNKQGDVTKLGRAMNQFPVIVQYSRMLVESRKYSQVVQQQVAALAAANEAGGLRFFYRDKNRQEEAQKSWSMLSNGEDESDLLAELSVFIGAVGMKQAEQVLHGLDVKNVQRAEEIFNRLSRHLNIPSYKMPLSEPNEEERKAILDCVYAGMADSIYTHVGRDQSRKHHEYVSIFGPDSERRQLSDRTRVDIGDAAVKWLVANPYNVQRHDRTTLPIVEQITKLDDLSQVQPYLSKIVSRERTGFVWRGRSGKKVLYAKYDLNIAGHHLGTTEQEVNRHSSESINAVCEFMKNSVKVRQVFEKANKNGRRFDDAAIDTIIFSFALEGISREDQLIAKISEKIYNGK